MANFEEIRFNERRKILMRKRLRNLALFATLACGLGLFCFATFLPQQASALTDETEQAILDLAKAEYREVATETACGPSNPSCDTVVENAFNGCFDDIVNRADFSFPEASPPDFQLEALAKCTVGAGRDHTRLLAAFTAAKPNIDASIQGLIDSDDPSDRGNTNACSFEGTFSWIACPLSVSLAELIDKYLTKVISDLLYVSTDNTFTPEFKKAWDSFRNIGIALVVIAGLIMIVSQAFGFEILDAYTIRKLMPRLAIALIFMALSWPLLRLGIGFINDLGIWAHDLIVGPFKNIGYPNVGEGEDNINMMNIVNSIIQAAVAVGGGAALYINGATLGFAGVLSLVGTTALALFIGWLVLAIRQTVIVAAVIMAPLAIAAYVLPGTQKLWTFWKNTLITSLVMFPIVMGFIAVGEALSRVMVQHPGKENQLMNIQAFLVLIAPYFMLPFAFKLAGGLVSTLFSMTNDRAKGVFDRGRKFRGETKSWRKGEIASGAMKKGSLTTAYAARTALARQGGLTPTRSARARYKLAHERLTEQTAHERADKDHGFSLGDTDETRAAIFANNRREFGAELNKIRARNGQAAYGADDIERKIARLEAGTGAQMGSDVMKAAAMRGQTVLDGAGWWNDKENRFDLEGFGEAAQHLASRGIFRAEDLGAMLGENQQRPDMAASSFSQRVRIAEMAIEKGDLRRQGDENSWRASNRGVLGNDVDRVTAENPYTAEERALVYGQTYQSMRNSSAELANLRTARAVAKQGGERIEGVLGGYTLDGIDHRTAPGGTATLIKGSHEEMQYEDRLVAEFATFANFQDMASSASPVAREQFAFQMRQQHSASDMSANTRKMLEPLLKVNDGTVTTQQIMEYFRGNGTGYQIDPATGKRSLVSVATPQEYVDMFTTRRREYSTGRTAAAASAGTRVDAPEAGGAAGPKL
ncbi:hypothetical protein KBD11_02125 [Candidatus Saccharibacteria bacterium]|nr:hypothetical protein [Candidatus Saccharibacteria bacterium]